MHAIVAYRARVFSIAKIFVVVMIRQNEQHVRKEKIEDLCESEVVKDVHVYSHKVPVTCSYYYAEVDPSYT